MKGRTDIQKNQNLSLKLHLKNKKVNLTRRKFLKFVSFGSASVIFPGLSCSYFRSKKAIPTVTGEIIPGKMGITSVHEHIKLQSDPVQREKSMAFVVSDLKRAKELGLETIVCVGPSDNAAGMREISLATGINIITCTGFYTLSKEQQSLKVEDFENHMIKEIEDGIQGTQIRPGVIKVAAGLPIKTVEKDLLIAAAHVQKRYNLPICTHAVSGCAEQQSILEKAGADLEHCYFSHVEATFGWSGRSVEQEIDYLQGVVEKGSTLSFNNFGNWNHTKPEDLALIIKELIRRGYDKRMVATMDVTWSFNEDGNLKILWEDTNEGGEDRNYSYLLRKAVPWMEKNGIPRKTINKFIIDNPRRIFTS